jgi:hypothetical protein
MGRVVRGGRHCSTERQISVGQRPQHPLSRLGLGALRGIHHRRIREGQGGGVRLAAGGGGAHMEEDDNVVSHGGGRRLRGALVRGGRRLGSSSHEENTWGPSEEGC